MGTILNLAAAGISQLSLHDSNHVCVHQMANKSASIDRRVHIGLSALLTEEKRPLQEMRHFCS